MQTEISRLIWIDLEMTGLDTTSDSILEIATIVTDSNLNELATGPVFAIRHEESVLEAMDSWNKFHHTGSGLWQRVLKDGVPLAEAEQESLKFIKNWVGRNASPMCGNSICQDRRFLYLYMPRLEAWMHYRNLDVSSVKELASRWRPDIRDRFKKRNTHRAMDDIQESIQELRHYREFFFKFDEPD